MRSANKRFWFFCGAASFLQLGSSPNSLVTGQTLVWQEDFDGDSVNTSAWSFDLGNGCDQGDGLCGWGNSEEQTYTMQNHEVADGQLTIKAEREPEAVDGQWYTSTRIRSIYPIAFLTGRIEARIKLPSGLGLWGAFWMLPANSSRGQWAATGEIDVMEAVNYMDTILGTIHYGGEYPGNRYAGCQQSSGFDFSTDFHVYALEWEAHEMRWYVDEQLYCQRTKWTSDVESIEPYQAPFDTEFELLLNLAVGGSLTGGAVDDYAFPARMVVDYVRVYEIDEEEEGETKPFFGVPICLPGTIEAEMFDVGGEGLGYGGSTTENEGSYRTDGAGRVGTSGTRRYAASMTEGDWCVYTIMTEDATYTITFQVQATSTASSAFKLLRGDNADCSDPYSGDILTEDLAVHSSEEQLDEWMTVEANNVWMEAGTHKLMLCVLGGLGVNVDTITFEPRDESDTFSIEDSGECATSSNQTRPYMFGTPWAIPGYIEAEFYDYGGKGLAFFDTTSAENRGDSELRPGDGVDITEAESNPSHGQFLSYVEEGEWFAFTCYAEEAGIWDVMASVAAGENNDPHAFRILVNATDCNDDTEDVVDLLDETITFSYTGSWEAFELWGKRDVWVPAGTHRLLFCAESGGFNLDYLRIFTPVPTPVPTPSPTVAHTPTPVMPEDTGGGYTWIYISVGCVLGVVGLARLGYIVYAKEHWRRKTHGHELYDGDAGPGEDGNGPCDEATTPSTLKGVSAMNGGKPGGSGPTISGKAVAHFGPTTPGGDAFLPPVDMGSLSRQTSVDGLITKSSVSDARGSDYGESYMGSHAQEHVLQETHQVDMSDPLPRVLPEASSWNMLQNAAQEPPSTFESSGTFASTTELLPRQIRSGPLESAKSGKRGWTPTKAQPVTSPVTGTFDLRPDSTHTNRRTPREAAGLEVSVGGSLWDRATASPIQSEPSVRTPVDSGSSATEAERDQFEEALLRAVSKQWAESKSSTALARGMKPVALSRSASLSDAQSKTNKSNKDAMLRAGKCWICVCSFENSAGQKSCVGCGRIAPLGLSRGRATPNRQSSWVPPDVVV